MEKVRTYKLDIESLIRLKMFKGGHNKSYVRRGEDFGREVFFFFQTEFTTLSSVGRHLCITQVDQIQLENCVSCTPTQKKKKKGLHVGGSFPLNWVFED